MLNQANISFIDEAFQPYVKRALQAHSFGVCRGTIQLNRVSSSGKSKVDRFNLSVPYAGQTLNWTVLFNSNCPELGPDFEFHNDTFLADPNVDIVENHIPSLANWQPLDPECLLNVLTELAILYKQHQVQLLSRQEQRLHVEYEMMIESDIRPEDVEVILIPNENAPTEAKFCIRLDMDFSRLPGRSNKATEDQAMLVVIFQHPNWNHIVPQLFLSPMLEATFGGPENLRLPRFSEEKCVLDYIPEVKKVIETKIEEVAHRFEMRNKFISAILVQLHRNVIEYDAINFSSITILLDHQDFYFLVHIHLPPGFPKDPPNVYLQSNYHMDKKGELLRHPVYKFNYNEHWPAPLMVNNLLNRIVEEEAVKFKECSLDPHNHR